jgi:hypothetical protein
VSKLPVDRVSYPTGPAWGCWSFTNFSLASAAGLFWVPVRESQGEAVAATVPGSM